MEIRKKIKSALDNHKRKLNSTEYSFLERVFKDKKMTEKQARWCVDLLNRVFYGYIDLSVDDIEDYKITKSRPKKPRLQASIKTVKDNKGFNHCDHGDLGSLGYRHGDWVTCPFCGERCCVW